MRRFSQRNSLVTLNEINITPLLDLAFVLLIIFVITRPLLEQSIDLQLPPGGRPASKTEAKDLRMVEITPRGVYRLGGRVTPLGQILAELDRDARANPNTVVVIRADKSTPYEFVAAIVDGCQKRRITRYALKTAPVQ
jgi:biopolymer transport protein ExbD